MILLIRRLAQLQDQIVGLRSPDLVRADDDGLAVLDIGLEAIEPVRARVREARQIQRVLFGRRCGFSNSSVSSGPLNFQPLSVG